ncbi:MAG: hypothetical protein HYY11_09725 [Candidatus Methylomirabilis oxyfera]|nr:hypothetical protein [Candidatus Methylomirabilis oxyfera]
MPIEQMNVDWPNALVGALVGWILGFTFDRLIIWSRRVRVAFAGFEIVETDFGTLYKMRFKLKGYEDPGECSCELTTNAHTTFAKWDECPNPLRNDRLNAFVPEMVPATFHQRLHVGREYHIPILVKPNNEFFVFDGWWFGRNAGYYTQPALARESVVAITLRGSGFAWRRAFTLQEIVGVGDVALSPSAPRDATKQGT